MSEYSPIRYHDQRDAEITRLRAELAAERVLCESYLLDKNQITQAWAVELDRVKELKAELAAEREQNDDLLEECSKLTSDLRVALVRVAKLREALVLVKGFLPAPSKAVASSQLHNLHAAIDAAL
jgi:ribosomal protein L29